MVCVVHGGGSGNVLLVLDSSCCRLDTIIGILYVPRVYGLLIHITLSSLSYSGNLSRVKTFANFVVLGQFAKILTAKMLIECWGV